MVYHSSRNQNVSVTNASTRYFPKDQIALGPGGHRNDWEGVVVWADKDAADAKVLAVCP